MNLKDLKLFSQFVQSAYKAALAKVEHHHLTEEQAVMNQYKIIQDKILDIQKNQEKPEQLADKEESKPQNKTILIDQDTKLNVLNEFSMQRFASKRISNVTFTLRVPYNLKNSWDVSLNFHGETEYGKAQGFGFFFHKD